VTFGGFVGLASFLNTFFKDQYFPTDKKAGEAYAAVLTTLCVFAGSFLRPVGGYLADRFGGIRMLLALYAGVAVTMLGMALLPPVSVALVLLFLGMGLLGMGNGSVFQLVPQRFRHEIGVMTGLVGMTGGIGGFYLASSLGYSKQYTGSYQFGLLIFAVLAMVALIGLTSIKGRWRTTWGAVGMTTARI
jgi:NNP family nitrate/nitrite transporter-like MFS transporter